MRDLRIDMTPWEARKLIGLVMSFQKLSLSMMKISTYCASTTLLMLVISSNLVVALSLESESPHQTFALQNFAAQVLNRGKLSGYGVYLGRGAVLTVAHVVGGWTSLEYPQVKIDNALLTAKVIKRGSFPDLDLALLGIDANAIPTLQLRLNPLCKSPAPNGARVVVAYPDRIVPSRVVSPNVISPTYRAHFGTLIREPQGSGSGLYDYGRKCLLGIMSAAITTVRPGFAPSRVGYFVPWDRIAAFIPAGSHL